MSAGLIHFLDKALLEIDEFTTSGSSTVPAGVTQAIIEGFSGGGSGGAGVNGGGGGSASILINKVVAVVAGESMTVTIGAGGVGPTGAVPASGNNGADTVVNSATNGNIFNAKGALGGDVGAQNKVGQEVVIIPGGALGIDGKNNIEGDFLGGSGDSGGGGAAGAEGNGGDGGAVVSAGSSASANSGAGGGGSGVGGAPAGGDGGSGKVTIYYINPQ